MTKLIVNCETGETLERDLTADEIAQQEIDEAESLVLQAEQAEIDAKRQALIDKLGLTPAEAKILLG